MFWRFIASLFPYECRHYFKRLGIVKAGAVMMVFMSALAGLGVWLGTDSSSSGMKLGVDPCSGAPFRETEVVAAGLEEMLLVTGGSGFIGSNLVEDLLDLGYQVRVFDNLVTGNIQYLPLDHPRLEFRYGDIMDMEALRAAMEGVTGVIHLAAASKVLPSLKNSTMATFNVNVNSVGTANVLEVAQQGGTVRKVIFAASSTFYGNQDLPYRETDHFSAEAKPQRRSGRVVVNQRRRSYQRWDDADREEAGRAGPRARETVVYRFFSIQPSSPYSASKAMGELQMQTFDKVYNLATVSLRFFMVYGPRQPRSGAYAIVTGVFAGQRERGEPLTIEGDGLQFRDFVHVKDIARGITLAYQSDRVRGGQPINLGSGEAHTVQELADLVSPNQKRLPARKNDLRGTLADTCKAKAVLGWSTRKDFRTEMSRIIEDTIAGRGLYIAEWFQDPGTVGWLERKIRGYTRADYDKRNSLIAGELKAHGNSWLADAPGLRGRHG
ncbi:hypothetical protein FOZ60_001642 [Perkinsus olseni]|uniref:UDP-glucuronic acid decarboxylase 1 n=1 Tax=Perkinsus olseni TaxID=32597 RepID=A0A7J6P147_PEROL|nr:hypothetical protein FOZ60_001642 [Perkinsus olseni]